jgi:hypothetical protein
MPTGRQHLIPRGYRLGTRTMHHDRQAAGLHGLIDMTDHEHDLSERRVGPFGASAVGGRAGVG